MSTQHTPGQWVAKTNQPDREFSWMVCSPSFTNWQLAEECKEADARLMAAAPELLEACKVAFDQTCSVGRPKDWEQLRAAIAKATGEQA